MTFRLVLLALLGSAVLFGGLTPTVRYEPEVVRLSGVIRRKTLPGPPNYLSVEKGDQPVVCLVLHLAKPINVGGGGDPRMTLNYPESGVRDLQLVWQREGDRGHAHLVGQPVVVTGTLMRGFTVHHFTRVLICIEALEANPDK